MVNCLPHFFHILIVIFIVFHLFNDLKHLIKIWYIFVVHWAIYNFSLMTYFLLFVTSTENRKTFERSFVTLQLNYTKECFSELSLNAYNWKDSKNCSISFGKYFSTQKEVMPWYISRLRSINIWLKELHFLRYNDRPSATIILIDKICIWIQFQLESIL